MEVSYQAPENLEDAWKLAINMIQLYLVLANHSTTTHFTKYHSKELHNSVAILQIALQVHPWNWIMLSNSRKILLPIIPTTIKSKAVVINVVNQVTSLKIAIQKARQE